MTTLASGSAPLAGKRVLVTRAREQAGELTKLLRERGAAPVEVAAISIQPLDDYSELDSAIARLAEYDWVILTSVNGVKHFLDRLYATARDVEALRSARICAIGPATAKALAERGVNVDYVPDKYIAEAVVEGLKALGVGGARILLPRALEAREVIVTDLIAAGATVDEVPVYVTVQPVDDKERVKSVLAQCEVDFVTFTSSSTVRNLVSLLDRDCATLGSSTVVCIGPITASTAKELGIRVDVVAKIHTMAGLVDAIVEYELEKKA